jgi:O-antigen/teichoic acid export membrane protein
MRLGRAALGSVGSTLAGNLLLVGSGILTARILGPEGKGAFAYAILLPSLALNLSILGLTKSLVYFVAGRRHSAGSAMGTSLILVVPLAAACALALPAVGEMLAPGDPGVKLLRITAWIMPPAAAYSLFRFAALGLQRYGEFNLLNVIDKLAPLVLLVVAILANSGNLQGFGAAYTLATVISLGAALLLLLPACGSLSIDVGYARDALGYGLRSHLGWLAEMLNYRLDMLILQAFAGSISLGFYSVAVSVAELLWLVPSCVSVVLLPRLTQSPEIRSRATPAICRLISLLAVVAAAGIALAAPAILPLLYGERFEPALGPLLMLLPGVAAYSVVRVLGADFSSRGRPGTPSLIAGLSLAITVVLDLVLIPRYGAMGAAMASTVAYAASGSLALLLYVRLTGARLGDLLVATPADLKSAWMSLSARRRIETPASPLQESP